MNTEHGTAREERHSAAVYDLQIQATVARRLQRGGNWSETVTAASIASLLRAGNVVARFRD